MPKCKYCFKRFDWKVVFSSNVRGFTDIKCKHCETINKPNSVYKVITTIIDVLPILLVGYLSVLKCIILMVAFFLCSPFFARYDIEEEIS